MRTVMPMRSSTLTRALTLSIGFLLATPAAADVAPGPDPWMACENKQEGDSCMAESVYSGGECTPKQCPDSEGCDCLYCEAPGADSGPAACESDSSNVAETSSSPTESTSETSDSSDDEGCGCSSSSSQTGGAALALLLGLVGLGLRRRAQG